MIDLYSWPTPNGQKVHIMLEECGLPYQPHAIDIARGDQFGPVMAAINPNGKIPAIVDRDGPGGRPLKVFESGAILLYLAEKTGRLLPADAAARSEVVQWLMFQMAGVGPMLGQANHFRNVAPQRIDYAVDRYTREARRLYGVMEQRLGVSAYLGGEHYSIADVAVYPWLRSAAKHGVDWAEFPRLRRWFDQLDGRPAVQRGVVVLSDRR